LEARLLEAVGQGRRDEAIEVLRIGRLSWRLRDDDNLLVSRIESQLYRAAGLGVERLRAAGRLLQGGDLSEEAIPVLIEALRNRSQRTIEFPPGEASEPTASVRSSVKPRQLVGQPAAPGISSGLVRRVKGPDSFAALRSGQVLVCDSIQPMMTHLVPLASAVVERRGGMLIHGAIIARELGIPCVNGIVDAMNLLDDGDFVTVDGHLGIVTVGPPEFDIELKLTSDGKN
jgi:pyruvate,water dikinase